jgi:hypothetical protein
MHEATAVSEAESVVMEAEVPLLMIVEVLTVGTVYVVEADVWLLPGEYLAYRPFSSPTLRVSCVSV